MMSTTLRNRVIAKLEKLGNNSEEVIKMVSSHFDEASKNYTSANTIAEYIRTIY